MTAVSDVFAGQTIAADGSGMPGGSGSAAEGDVGVHARTRASLAAHGSLDKITGWVASEARTWWWTPESLPTLARVWADRMPDRERVPGNNPGLYWAWVVYNHTVGLLVTAAALTAVGFLTMAVWVVRHPARLLLLAAAIGAVAMVSAAS